MVAAFGIVLLFAGAAMGGSLVGLATFARRARVVRTRGAALWLAVAAGLIAVGLALIPPGARAFMGLVAVIPAAAGLLFAWIDLRRKRLEDGGGLRR